jgi:hypothetical protein
VNGRPLIRLSPPCHSEKNALTHVSDEIPLVATASQTVGPFFSFGLTTNTALGCVAGPDTPGERIFELNEPSGLAARSSETVDKPGTDRVWNNSEYYRHGAGHLQQRDKPGAAGGQNNVRRERHGDPGSGPASRHSPPPAGSSAQADMSRKRS